MLYHPSGSLKPSDADLDMTDRLIQVGRILNIAFVDHLIITPITYLSFRGEGLMDKLETSLKYVPTYQIIEQIRKEEKKIAREKLALEKDQTKAARDATKAEREQKQKLKEQLAEKEKSMVNFLLEKDISVEQIAKILDMTPKAVEKIISNQSAGI